MNFVFIIVAQALDGIASVTGFTYNEINIIAYYIIIPFIYVVLLDRIIHRHILKIVYVLTWTGILCFVRDFAAFSNALFQYSVDFLMFFSIIGLDYVSASVVICVLLPAIVFVALLLFAFPSLRHMFSTQNDKPMKPTGHRR